MHLEQRPSLGTAAVPAAVAPAPPAPHKAKPAAPEPAAVAGVAPVARTGGAIASVTSGAIAPVGIFTHQDFKNMAKHPTGGKAACQKQRYLRACLLATADEHACSLMGEADLTFPDFDWKAMLKSLPADAEIVGTAVCRFTFRWLSGVCDPQYDQS